MRKYSKALESDELIISVINQRFRKPGKTWKIQHASFTDDMNGIDAIGYIETKTTCIPVVIQIKSITFFSLTEYDRYKYLKKIKKHMQKKYPIHSRRIIAYKRWLKSNGSLSNSLSLYNYNLDNQITQLTKRVSK